MEAFEAEIELLRAIYSEELTTTPCSLAITVLPQRDRDSQDFVQATVQLTFSPHPIVTLTNCKGLDREQTDALALDLNSKLSEIQSEGTDTVLYPLFEYSKEALTALNESVSGQCMICLEDFGSNLNSLARVPGCFHRFHKKCLLRLWRGKWTEAKARSCEEESGERTAKLACAICRHEVRVDEVKKVFS